VIGVRKTVAAAAIAGSMLVGGVGGAVLYSATVLTAAAERAGLGTVRFVPEPVAAAAYFATVLGRTIPAERVIVVYDLGAGTFDVSVVRPSPGGFDVVATDGLPDVGGVDLDAAVVGHIRTLTAGATTAWQRLDWPQTVAEYQALQNLWQAARVAKEQLSWQDVADLYVPIAERTIRVTRDEFEMLAQLKEPLVQLRGRWVEVRPDQIERALAFIQKHQTGKMELAEALSTALAPATLDGVPVAAVEASG